MVDENTDLDENENDSVPVDLVRVPSTSVQSNRRSSASMLIGMFLTTKSPLIPIIVQYTVLTVLLIIVYMQYY